MDSNGSLYSIQGLVRHFFIAWRLKGVGVVWLVYLATKIILYSFLSSFFLLSRWWLILFKAFLEIIFVQTSLCPRGPSGLACNSGVGLCKICLYKSKFQINIAMTTLKQLIPPLSSCECPNKSSTFRVPQFFQGRLSRLTTYPWLTVTLFCTFRHFNQLFDDVKASSS